MQSPKKGKHRARARAWARLPLPGPTALPALLCLGEGWGLTPMLHFPGFLGPLDLVWVEPSRGTGGKLKGRREEEAGIVLPLPLGVQQ